MQLMKNRAGSMFLVFVIYVFAIIIGVLTFNAFSFSVYLNLLIADVVATVFVFIFSIILKNASVYDPYWSVQPIVIVVGLTVGCELSAIRLMTLIAVCFWGIRLTLNWAYTFHSFTYQDWRYVMLKEKTGVFYPIVNFLGIHLFPTLVVYLCVLPIVHIFSFDLTFSAWCILPFILSILAVVLQGVADLQMHVFRKKKTGGLIHNGLWKYSRHPNYLGEILTWWGIALMLLSVNISTWYLCLGALVNTLMFLFISVPMADKRQSKKEGFDEYKKRTRALLPIKK